jgi:hypothetical protein
LTDLLKKLGIPIPKQLLAVTETPHRYTLRTRPAQAACCGSRILRIYPVTANPGKGTAGIDPARQQVATFVANLNL